MSTITVFFSCPTRLSLLQRLESNQWSQQPCLEIVWKEYSPVYSVCLSFFAVFTSLSLDKVQTAVWLLYQQRVFAITCFRRVLMYWNCFLLWQFWIVWQFVCDPTSNLICWMTENLKFFQDLVTSTRWRNQAPSFCLCRGNCFSSFYSLSAK